jgi:hypothetical protein
MNHNTLYTIILDYKGGTYISQVRGDSPTAAVEKWVARVTDAELITWTLKRSDLEGLCQENPVLLNNCISVWCVTLSTRKGLALVNIVATQDETLQSQLVGQNESNE